MKYSPTDEIMLLAIDIGNSSVSAVLIQGRRIVRQFRLPTEKCKKRGLLARELRLRLSKRAITGICIVSVVPGIDRVATAACKKTFGFKPLFVTSATIKMPVQGRNKRHIGADRLLVALAAYNRYKKAVIIIDAGTAITIDVVSAEGVYSGGVIVPGIWMAARALHEMTARLPLVKIRRPKKLLGWSTAGVIRSGIYHGYAGLVDRLVLLISAEMKIKPVVVATGGDANLIAKQSITIRSVEPNLIFNGLRIVYASLPRC